MSAREDMTFNHDAGRGKELQLSITPQLQPQTPCLDTMTDNNHRASSSGVGLRPRGRPPGAKNKPKPPIVITRDIPNMLNSHLLEITAGDDVSKCLYDYVRHEGKGICILDGNGSLTDVNLHQPTGGIVTLKGKFEIRSISGTILPSSTPIGVEGLTVHLSSNTGQMIGGSVMPPLVSSDPVKLIIASFDIDPSEELISVVDGQKEHEPSCLDVAGQVAEGDDGLFSVGGSTSEMRNVMCSSTSHPSSSASIRLFGRDITVTTTTSPPKSPRF
jgi:predicted DNA-binding protein with PD1-like motif